MDQVTRFAVTGAASVSAELRVSSAEPPAGSTYPGNASAVAVLEGVRPDAFGNLFVDLQAATGPFSYVSSLRLTAVPEPSAGLLPAAAAVAALGLRRGGASPE